MIFLTGRNFSPSWGVPLPPILVKNLSPHLHRIPTRPKMVVFFVPTHMGFGPNWWLSSITIIQALLLIVEVKGRITLFWWIFQTILLLEYWVIIKFQVAYWTAFNFNFNYSYSFVDRREALIFDQYFNRSFSRQVFYNFMYCPGKK